MFVHPLSKMFTVGESRPILVMQIMYNAAKRLRDGLASRHLSALSAIHVYSSNVMNWVEVPYCFYLLAGFNLFVLLPIYSFARCCDKRIPRSNNNQINAFKKAILLSSERKVYMVTNMLIKIYHVKYIWNNSFILHIISLLTGDMNSINWPRSQCVAS